MAKCKKCGKKISFLRVTCISEYCKACEFLYERDILESSSNIQNMGDIPQEILESSSKMHDLTIIPQDTWGILGDYGKLLENLPTTNPLRPLSLLPHPKDKIENALKTAIGTSKDKEIRSVLETNLLFLEDFIPDNEVPKDFEENFKMWCSHKDWKNPKTREILAVTLTRLFVLKYGEDAEQKTEEFISKFKKNKSMNMLFLIGIILRE